MLNRTTRFLAGVVACCFVSPVSAQPASEDAVLDAMRGLVNISAADQRRIEEWVQKQVGRLTTTIKASSAGAEENPEADRDARNAAFRKFRGRVLAQFRHSGNSAAFRSQFVAQAVQVAVAQFSNDKLDDTVAWALARVLADMNVPDIVPGLLAGLKSKSASARYTCARGLTKQQGAFRADPNVLTQVIQAVVDAGSVERSPVVLSHLYRVIGIAAQPGDVFNAFMTLFDKRLAYRRGPAVYADGAEFSAFEFFRASGVINALNADQKAELVRRVAVFLRLDAQRYDTPVLDGDERMTLELSMVSAEDVLAVIVPGRSGAIDAELQRGGHDRRAEILAKVYEWVGDPQSKTAGVLNAAPWNVPIGAP